MQMMSKKLSLWVIPNSNWSSEKFIGRSTRVECCKNHQAPSSDQESRHRPLTSANEESRALVRSIKPYVVQQNCPISVSLEPLFAIGCNAMQHKPFQVGVSGLIKIIILPCPSFSIVPPKSLSIHYLLCNRSRIQVKNNQPWCTRKR